jgi:adenylate cyclase class 1
VLDVVDIRGCRFRAVDEESSGSTQTNVLKEEFYRTCVVICGKTPLWWVCHGSKNSLSYSDAANELVQNPLWDDNLIDLGNLEKVEEHEYFGAALWQINKALDRPLKSIIKMLMLKMQLDASDEELVCHKFRQHIMIKKFDSMIPDPSLFSMIFIMNYYEGKSSPDTLKFIKECFYLRCGIKSCSRKYDSIRELANVFFKKIDIDKVERERLDRFSNWDLESQIRFGRQIFMVLIDIYRDISKSRSGVTTRIDKEDLTIIGRKIQIFYEVKQHKVSLLPRPMEKLNIPGITIHLDESRWNVYAGNIRGGHLVSHADILYVITFIVKNDLYDPVRMHMLPNRSSVSLPEVQNLSAKIRDFLYNDTAISRNDYLKNEVITRILVVVSFEEEPWEKNSSNIGLIYKTSWGDVYVRRFNTERRLREFVLKSGIRGREGHIDYYLQKKCINFSIIMTNVKRMIQGAPSEE